MQRLYDIGFGLVGTWTLEDAALRLNLDRLVEHRNILYAFVSGDAVLYVGKTTQTLQRRMLGYLRPSGTQRTNLRNRQAITALLQDGRPVEILALPDSGLMRFGAFHLNFAAGLEDSIIDVLQPVWNGGKTSAVLESVDETDPPDGSGEAAMAAGMIEQAAQFTLILHDTYFRQGFFNVPSAYSDRIAGDRAQLTLYCGPERLVVPAIANRTATLPAQSLRIMGRVPLREWFQRAEVLEPLTVTILSPTELDIQRKAE